VPTDLLLPALLCLLPVFGYLGLLVLLDSYQLMPLRQIAALLGAGMVAALVGLALNGALLGLLGLSLDAYSRLVAPLVEEALKAAVIVWLVRRHRIGFLIDAAIAGFAVGSGFALIENLHALSRVPEAGLPTWIVRGFGTAVMHGGATAAFAVMALLIQERHESGAWRAAAIGFAAAALLHGLFNHLIEWPQLATVVVLVVVPALLLGAFSLGERALGEWLGRGFDADAELLGLLRSGEWTDAPVGRYLATLRARFPPAVLADLLCYLRVFTELSMRAKGQLMMREQGFRPQWDAAVQADLDELRYLERAIGVAGLVALAPLLPMRRRALRQLVTA
jgi:RsiW-degrading membrane proteinase PrsW (M82 family)